MERGLVRDGPFVAIGLLTQRDLDILGSGFLRTFPLDSEAVFDDLLAAINASDREAQRSNSRSGGSE